MKRAEQRMETRLENVSRHIETVFECLRQSVLAGDDDGKRRKHTSEGMRQLVALRSEMEHLGLFRPVRNREAEPCA